MKKKIVVISIVLVLATIGCISEEKETGPTITLIPSTGDVEISKGYGITFAYGEVDLDLPENYSIPKAIMAYKVSGENQYTLIIDKEYSGPAEEVRNITISEKIKIRNLKEGVTKIILNNKI